MKIDHHKFYKEYRSRMGSLNQKQVDNLNFLLNSFEMDPLLTFKQHIAYGLATVKWETGDTFAPIREKGTRDYFIKRYGSHKAVGKELGNLTPEDGALFCGRGFVQITGRSNYYRFTSLLRNHYPALIAKWETDNNMRFDLITKPDQALDPIIAYLIMSIGMVGGYFTGKKLSDYINNLSCNYFSARRIINRLDQAEVISDFAKEFERML